MATVEWEIGVNGRTTDPTFMYHLVNPATEVQACLISFR